MANLEVDDPDDEETEPEPIRVSARHIDGKAVKELDFELIVDLVQKRHAYKNYIDENLNIEMLYCVWKTQMRKLPRPWHVFCWKVKPKASYKSRRSWRLRRLPPEKRPINEIPLTLEGGREIYTRLLMSDRKLEHMKQNYYEAVEKAYRAGYSVTIMAKAIGVNRTALRREIRRNMDWYASGQLRHHTPKWIWEAP